MNDNSVKVLMSCPKCGKESTEYDNNRWRCLHCGQKFFFDPNAKKNTDESWFSSPAMIFVFGVVFFTLIVIGASYETYCHSKTKQLELQLQILQAQSNVTQVVSQR